MTHASAIAILGHKQNGPNIGSGSCNSNSAPGITETGFRNVDYPLGTGSRSRKNIVCPVVSSPGPLNPILWGIMELKSFPVKDPLQAAYRSYDAKDHLTSSLDE
jgi:hypothetical protein